jgi:thioredoxin-dependent peroxiredoxin
VSVEPGQPFPSFTAPSHDGETVDLTSYRGEDNLVVFFYPKATTRGCVRETTEFSARRSELDALGTKIVGVSVDDAALQSEHAIQCAASFPLLCDIDKALTTQLGILNERGMASRTTYVIGRDGVVRKVFPNVTVDGHVDEVLQAVAELQQ